jgi:hypothetical protein
VIQRRKIFRYHHPNRQCKLTTDHHTARTGDGLPDPWYPLLAASGWGTRGGNPTDDSYVLIPETEDDCDQFTNPVVGVACFGLDDYYDDGTGNWSDVTVTDVEDGDLTPRAWSYDVTVWTEATEKRADLAWDDPDALTMYDFTGWVGEYEIHYNAKDSAGLEAVEVIRTVIVAEPTDLDPIPKPKATSGCFIGAASQPLSSGMLISLSGLMALAGLVGCFLGRITDN